jgi:hypothetical protein
MGNAQCSNCAMEVRRMSDDLVIADRVWYYKNMKEMAGIEVGMLLKTLICVRCFIAKGTTDQKENAKRICDAVGVHTGWYERAEYGQLLACE